MDPYLSMLAITMMNKFTAYEEFNIRMNKLQIVAIQFLKEGGEFTKKHLDSYIILINLLDTGKVEGYVALIIINESSPSPSAFRIRLEFPYTHPLKLE